MRTLIESIVNRELSILIERRKAKKSKRRSRRRRRAARLTPRQKRDRSYNNAFGNQAIDEKAVEQLQQFAEVTGTHMEEKPYSWSLTRWVWASRRIADCAKTFKKEVPGMEPLRGRLATTFSAFIDKIMSKENPFKMTPEMYTDAEKRLTYIYSYFDKAYKYGQANKNGWDGVVQYIYSLIEDTRNNSQ